MKSNKRHNLDAFTGRFAKSASAAQSSESTKARFEEFMKDPKVRKAIERSEDDIKHGRIVDWEDVKQSFQN